MEDRWTEEEVLKSEIYVQGEMRADTDTLSPIPAEIRGQCALSYYVHHPQPFVVDCRVINDTEGGY